MKHRARLAEAFWSERVANFIRNEIFACTGIYADGFRPDYQD
jgi:hypothetical protein